MIQRKMQNIFFQSLKPQTRVHSNCLIIELKSKLYKQKNKKIFAHKKILKKISHEIVKSKEAKRR